MALNLTDNLGPKVDAHTGRWIPVSETYLEFQSTSLQPARLITAQVSDLYLVRWFLQVSSVGTSASVRPRVDFFTYGAGVGRAGYQAGATMACVDRDATSSTWQLIRAASSDIFISTAVASNGAAPIFHLYVGISRMP